MVTWLKPIAISDDTHTRRLSHCLRRVVPQLYGDVGAHGRRHAVQETRCVENGRHCASGALMYILPLWCNDRLRPVQRVDLVFLAVLFRSRRMLF